MNWIGKLLGFKDIPMTDVKKVLEESRQEAKEIFSDVLELKKDISEPVYAIVEVMRKYPSRFKVKFDDELSKNREFSMFNVKDVKTGQKVIYSTYYFYGQNHCFSWDWLTGDEVKFLGEEGLKMYEKKLERKKSFQRARMKGIYNAS